MRRRRHLVVYAKVPRLGRVKSRLARDIGPVRALAFYRRTLARLLHRLSRDRRWRLVLAGTPDREVGRLAPWRSLSLPSRVPRVGQGTGDLGRRMARTFRSMPAGPVVIVGTDIPDVTREHIWQAYCALGASDAVVGPAPDGGYWLIGLRRGPSLPALFSGVRWSSPTTLADTLANLGRVRVSLLATLEDVDDAASLARWRAAVRARRRGRDRRATP